MPGGPTPLRALIVEDSQADAELLIHALEEGFPDVVTHQVQTADELRLALQNEMWDVVLSDQSLPP